MGTIRCGKCQKPLAHMDTMPSGDYGLCDDCKAKEDQPMLFGGCDPGLYTTTIAILDGFLDLVGWFQVYSSEDEYPRVPNTDRKKGQRYFDPVPEQIAQDTLRFTAAVLSKFKLEGISTEKMEWSARHSDTQGWVHHNRGIIHACCLERSVAFHMLNPQQIKKTVTGNGNAGKDAVVREIWRRYGDKFESFQWLRKNNHIADAIGAAMTLVRQEVGYIEEEEE